MILVTGGAGYIGGHTVKALKQSGFEPLIFDNFSTGHRSFVGNTPCVAGDLCNPIDVDRVFSAHPIEGVLHFAGAALVPESHEKPGLYYRINVMGGVNLLEAMQRYQVKRIIFSSTCATYGIPETTPIRENFPQRPISPYGETKLAFEKALHWFHDSFGMEYLSLRYFNAAGADPDGLIGEDHTPETHLIPLILDAVIGKRSDVKVFGTDYDTPDGTCLRDYIHVDDLARAHVAGIQALIEGRLSSQAINLGTGRGYSVRQVIDAARKVTGREFKVVETARRPGDPPALVAAVDHARELLGWTTVDSGLEHIISTAWNWHQKLRR